MDKTDANTILTFRYPKAFKAEPESWCVCPHGLRAEAQLHDTSEYFFKF